MKKVVLLVPHRRGSNKNLEDSHTTQHKVSTTTTQPRGTRQLKDAPPVPQQHQARTLAVDTDIDKSSDVPVTKGSCVIRAKKGPPVNVVAEDLAGFEDCN